MIKGHHNMKVTALGRLKTTTLESTEYCGEGLVVENNKGDLEKGHLIQSGDRKKGWGS